MLYKKVGAGHSVGALGRVEEVGARYTNEQEIWVTSILVSH